MVEDHLGTIPACAGEPPIRRRSPWIAWDYPRVRGGTPNDPDLIALKEGLSPRARGNHCLDDTSQCQRGTIPACAGEPRNRSLLGPPLTDYPRVRRGTPNDPDLIALKEGLSPRARGNRRHDLAPAVWHGTIPACAGEPC